MNIALIIAIVGSVALVAALTFVGYKWKLTGQMYWRRVAIVAGLLVLGVGTSLLPLTQPDENNVVTNSDIIFLVDTTYSMNALDGRDGDTRLLDVQHDIERLSKELGGSRIGIVTFDRNATIYLPLTTTYSDVETAISTLSTAMYIDATGDPSLTKALETVASYIQKVQEADITRQRVLVVLTDGELTGKVDTAESVRAAAGKLAPTINSAVVVGYGTGQGAPMPEIRPNYENDTLKPERSEYNAQALQNGKFDDVISRRDEAQLQSLATALNGRYVPAQNSNELTTVVTEARKLAADRQTSSPASQALRQNLLHIPLALVILAWVVAVEVIGWNRLRIVIGSWRRS